MIFRPHALMGALLLAHVAVATAQVHEGKTIVTARLVADKVRFQPGEPFTAAVQLTIAPGWHVYWQNPGDTALPVNVDWQAPDGVTTAALQWPAPDKYEEEGGVTVFGYEDETMLLTTVSPSRSFAGESLTLEARADWLVCEKLCIPGEAALSLTLPKGSAAPSPQAPAIAKYRARVPRPGAVRISRAHAREASGAWVIALEFAGAAAPAPRVLDFFPRLIDGFTIDHKTIRIIGNKVEFTVLPDEARSKLSRISGVVRTAAGATNVGSPISTASDSAPVPGRQGAEGGSSQLAASGTAARGSSPSLLPSAPPARSAPSARLESTDDWLSRDFTTSNPDSKRHSLPLLLLFAVLGGLLLNVMPCVLPVISLKILSFVHQAGDDRRRTRILGLLFGAGVVVSFWILVAAVAAVRATAAQIGWGFQFQSPLFVLVMSVVVLVFALNLFGVFEIAGPSFSGAAAGAEGRTGAFLHGVLATVLATPCTAPFLGTAIGFAFTQSIGILFLVFTAAAIGLALPYVLLSWHPGWLRWLPRPGVWMIRFKQAMGFVLIATVIWLLSVLGSQLGPEGVVWSLVFLTIVAFAVWLIGQVPGRVVPRLAAVALVAGGYFWALEHELRWRAPVSEINTATPAKADGIEWEPFSLADLRDRVERGETVFIDFTADWCWSCKVNERTVLASDSVEEHMKRLDVTAVKADWTRRNPEITRLLAKFGRAGVPFYVVFPAGRLGEPIPLSEVITPASVIEALDRAGPSHTERKS